MSKQSLLLFGAVVVIFGLLTPYVAMSGTGSDRVGIAAVEMEPEEDAELAQQSFQTNCGACHVLQAAGTDGIVGPDLDALLGDSPVDASETRVQSAIENGILGRMPAGIVRGEEAELVARYVAEAASRQ